MNLATFITLSRLTISRAKIIPFGDQMNFVFCSVAGYPLLCLPSLSCNFIKNNRSIEAGTLTDNVCIKIYLIIYNKIQR